jgi:adenylate cyclase
MADTMSQETKTQDTGTREAIQEPMSSAGRFPSPRLKEGQSIFTTGVYERPVSERPSHDTLEAIAAWLIGPARRIASAPQAIDEYAWRLYAAGLPVLRVTLHCGTLHPQFLGSAYVWWRNTAQTQEIMVGGAFWSNRTCRSKNSTRTRTSISAGRKVPGPDASVRFARPASRLFRWFGKAQHGAAP